MEDNRLVKSDFETKPFRAKTKRKKSIFAISWKKSPLKISLPTLPKVIDLLSSPVHATSHRDEPQTGLGRVTFGSCGKISLCTHL